VDSITSSDAGPEPKVKPHIGEVWRLPAQNFVKKTWRRETFDPDFISDNSELVTARVVVANSEQTHSAMQSELIAAELVLPESYLHPIK